MAVCRSAGRILKILVEGTCFILRQALNVVLVLVVWVLRNSFVGQDLGVEVKLDGTHIGGTDSALKVEALVPSSENVHSFVVFERIFMLVYMGGLNW